jgi:hypothetical protein
MAKLERSITKDDLIAALNAKVAGLRIQQQMAGAMDPLEGIRQAIRIRQQGQAPGVMPGNLAQMIKQQPR